MQGTAAHRRGPAGPVLAHRARRLLPGLIILILGVAAYAYAFRTSIDVGAVRGDALSTLLYVANWHFIVSDQGYFIQAAAPSPLLHTWSLAVEEQYYLIWPLVALLVVRRWGSAPWPSPQGSAPWPPHC